MRFKLRMPAPTNTVFAPGFLDKRVGKTIITDTSAGLTATLIGYAVIDDGNAAILELEAALPTIPFDGYIEEL